MFTIDPGSTLINDGFDIESMKNAVANDTISRGFNDDQGQATGKIDPMQFLLSMASRKADSR